MIAEHRDHGLPEADPALIYDTLAREREAGEMVFDTERQDTAPRSLTVSRGRRFDMACDHDEPTAEQLATYARWQAVWAAEGHDGT